MKKKNYLRKKRKNLNKVCRKMKKKKGAKKMKKKKKANKNHKYR